MEIEVKILDSRIDTYKMRPQYQTAGACAIDLRACTLIDSQSPIESAFTLYPCEKVKIGAGFSMHLVDQSDDIEADSPYVRIAALLIPRSGLGNKGIHLSNVVGLVDSDYQGEFIISIHNTGTDEFVINPMERLAQAMLVPALIPEFRFVSEFSARTERGDGGFGSTGT